MMRKIEAGSATALMAMLQIFLLITSVPAQSHILKGENSFGQSSFMERKNDLFSERILGFLALLFSIKQIGIVSAQEIFCCEKTATSNGICQDVIDDSQCDTSNDLRVRGGSCSDDDVPSNFCRTGTCIDRVEGVCTVSSEPACNPNGMRKIWEDRDMASIPECKRAACILGNHAEFTTRRQCEIRTQEEGIENMDFRQDIDTEAETIRLSLILQNPNEKGACVTQSSGNSLPDCKIIGQEQCNNQNGVFFSGYLCSHPDLKSLGITCTAKSNVKCADENSLDGIYWYDSCGNRENIYGTDYANPDDADSFKIITGENSCSLEFDASGNPTNVEECGNCNIAAQIPTICSKVEGTEPHASAPGIDGKNFACKPSSCEFNGEKYLHGESWCVYEGATGATSVDNPNTPHQEIISADIPGSEQWKFSCNRGKIEINQCGEKRNKLCSQRTTEENGISFRTASCVTNMAAECIALNPLQRSIGENIVDNSRNIQDCNANPHCRLEDFFIDQAEDTTLRIKLCLPRYPPGGSNYCTLMDGFECPLIFERTVNVGESASLIPFLGIGSTSVEWELKHFQNCALDSVAQNLNNICASLGDCGSYINTLGQGTDNFEVTQHPNGQDYYPRNLNRLGQNYADIESDGKNLNEIRTGDDVGRIGSPLTDSNLNPEGASRPGTPELENIDNNQLVEQINPQFAQALGVTGASLYFNSIRSFVQGIPGLYESYYGPFGEEGTTISPTSLGSFLAATAGAIIGAYVGAAVAQRFGIQGAPADLVVYGGAYLGAYGAGAAVGSQWVAATFATGGSIFIGAVIATILILRIGETENRPLTFSCLPWEPPLGGENCEACNSGEFPCTAYKCQSLGQACRLIDSEGNVITEDSGTGDETALCVWNNQDDTTPPQITFGEIEEGFIVDSRDSFDVAGGNAVIRKANSETPEGHIKVSETVSFSVNTNEIARCKYSFNRQAVIDSFALDDNEANEALVDSFNERAFGLNHSLDFSIPGFDNENIFDAGTNSETGKTEWKARIYISCADANSRFNPNPKAIEFNIIDEDDLEVPIIEDISPATGAGVAYGETQKQITIFLNEPGACKYNGVSGTDYNENSNSEWNIQTSEFGDFSGTMIISDLQEGENLLYLRCRDSFGNAQTQDTEYVLNAVQNPLEISAASLILGNSRRTLNLAEEASVAESIELTGDAETLENVELSVLTSGGFENGNAECSYRLNTMTNRVLMQETGGTTHNQETLNFNTGEYEVEISCEDSAGSSALKYTRFSVTKDEESPRITNIYSQNRGIRVRTNEDAKCYYKTEEILNLGLDESGNVQSDGTAMPGIFQKEHSINNIVKGTTYFVQCIDTFGNVGSRIKINPSF